jgi:hypothetical protein
MIFGSSRLMLRKGMITKPLFPKTYTTILAKQMDCVMIEKVTLQPF